MATEIDAALNGGPWALSGLLYMELPLDDEGRPLAERRAPSAVKQSVEIELRTCPYPDERRGAPMNVSALAQITRHLDAAISDIAAFRQLANDENPTWFDMLTTVVDQLAGPAVFMLRARDPHCRIPAIRAVGHKLAAGYSGVVRRLVRGRALGEQLVVSAQTFLEIAHRSGALLGASEACAGPSRLIERVTEVFLRPLEDVPPLDDEARLLIARGLAKQIALGVAWELFDSAIERELLLDRGLVARMTPRNPFMERRLATRVEELTNAEELAGVENAEQALPTNIDPDDLETLRGRMQSAGQPHALEEDAASHAFEELIARGEGGMLCEDRSDRAQLACRLGAYLPVYSGFLSLLWRLETALRTQLELSTDSPMKLNKMILPSPRALGWWEAVLGHRVESTAAFHPQVVVRNHRRSVDVTDLVVGASVR